MHSENPRSLKMQEFNSKRSHTLKHPDTKRVVRTILIKTKIVPVFDYVEEAMWVAYHLCRYTIGD
jgi:hypothetical protein